MNRFILIGFILVLQLTELPGRDFSVDRPNILWITCEDISPHFGCYGDPDAKTPVLDKLAQNGIVYSNAFANAPVCTPARSTLITGVYACSLGTQHLRGTVKIPENINCFTEYLRENGYYCSNNYKEDYNFKTPENSWDESGKNAHWRNRKKGQPFFSVFNFELTHQSQTRYTEEELIKRNEALPQNLRHSADAIHLPPYYPDTREIRNNVAALHTQITLLDLEVNKLLNQLKEDGLNDNTIVFFFSDHGDGIPRGKRWLHETGTRVPLIIYFPEKWQHLAPAQKGYKIDRLVSFVDFAPSVLSLLELDIPDYMMGNPFLGRINGAADTIVFLFEDRIGQVLDLSRAVRTPKYRYIRNYQPYRPVMPYCEYSEITPIRKELRRLDSLTQLKGVEKWLMAKNQPIEELYNVQQDPLELNNLAQDPGYSVVLEKMRNVLWDKFISISDLSFLPEAEMVHRAGVKPPYRLTQNKSLYDVEKVLKAAELTGRNADVQKLKLILKDKDPAVRYWGINAIMAMNGPANNFLSDLKKLITDNNPSVRVAAAEALCGLDNCNEALKVLVKELENQDARVVMQTGYALDMLGQKAEPVYPDIMKILPSVDKSDDIGTYHIRPLNHIVSKMK